MTLIELFERLSRLPDGFSLGVSARVEFRPLARCRCRHSLPPAIPAVVETTGEPVELVASNLVPFRRGRAA